MWVYCMKRFLLCILAISLVLLSGCTQPEPAQVAATTLPVYEFTARLCQGTPITVTRLVTEAVSCLHDYSLNVRQVKAAEAAQVIVISGAGLEEFMHDLIGDREVVDASSGIELLCSEHSHEHEEEAAHHHHEEDPHIWLSAANAQIMAENICKGLQKKYPAYADTFADNLSNLQQDLKELDDYGKQTLEKLRCRELITFHDGFAYLADAYGLTILEAVEEESGREASAKELIHLIEEVEHHNLPAIFTEKSGSVSASGIIARETGCKSFSLDMAMSGDSYFGAMYHNIDTIKEALG